jgi:hypothetical protein
MDLPAAERDEWDRLWADVKATLAEAKKPAPPRQAGNAAGRPTSKAPVGSDTRAR